MSTDGPQWWRRFGRLDDGGCTRLERRWYAARYREGPGKRPTPEEAARVRALVDAASCPDGEHDWVYLREAHNGTRLRWKCSRCPWQRLTPAPAP